MICELCVSRLREAYFFRMIVEMARAAIQQKGIFIYIYTFKFKFSST